MLSHPANSKQFICCVFILMVTWRGFVLFCFFSPKETILLVKEKSDAHIQTLGKCAYKNIKTIHTHACTHTNHNINIVTAIFSSKHFHFYTWKYLGKPSFNTAFVVPKKNAFGTTLSLFSTWSCIPDYRLCIVHTQNLINISNCDKKNECIFSILLSYIRHSLCLT